jgi:hypothetical protein
MTYLKSNLIALYLLAILSVWLPMPWDSGPILQKIAVALIAIHAIETLVAFKYVKAYEGPLGKSVALSLLYGLLHWLPIARRMKKAADLPTTSGQ